MFNIIKEYLVSLGFEIDQKSVAEADKALNRLDKVVNSFMESFADNAALKAFSDNLDKALSSAGAEIAGFVATTEGLIAGLTTAVVAASLVITTAITAITVKIATSVAKADLQIQLFARRMYTTVENARSLKAVMDTMGLKDIDQLKDVALNPELRKQFYELRKLSSGLSLNLDQTQGLRNIRAVMFQFQKLGLIINYFFQQLAGNLGKLLQGPLKELSTFVKEFMDGFAKNIPGFAKAIASILAIFVKLFVIGAKIMAVFAKIPIVGPLLLSIIKNFDKILDVLNAVLDKVNGVLDKFPGATTETGDRKDQQHATISISHYLEKLYNLLQTVWNYFLQIFRIVRDKLEQSTKIFKDAQKVIVKNVIQPTQAAAAYAGKKVTEWGRTTFGHSNKHLEWSTWDKSSNLIDAFTQKLESRLSEKFKITAGMAALGHVSHGRGTAFDIGLGGRSDASIVNLMKAVLATPGLKKANLELSLPHYRRILAELDRQGVNYAGRVSNNKSRFSHGDHLHVGLQPAIKQEITIHVNGARDGKAIAREINDHLQQNAMRATRIQQGQVL